VDYSIAYAIVLAVYCKVGSGDHGSKYRGWGLCPGASGHVSTYVEAQSCLAGAPTSVVAPLLAVLQMV